MLASLLIWSALLTAMPADTGQTQPATPVIIRSITFQGNVRTRERIIRREMDLRVGDIISAADLPGKLAWDQRKISNTNLFVVVDVSTRADSSQIRPGQPVPLDLTVTMKERWYWFAYPFIELADPNFNQWYYERNHDLGRLIYSARLSNRNLTGNGDRLSLIAETGFTHRLLMSYSWPYLDKAQTLGLRADVSYATNKNIAFTTVADKQIFLNSETDLRKRTYAGLTLTRREGFYKYHALGVSFNYNTIADTIARLNGNYFNPGQTRQRYIQLGYAFSYDRRDNVVYPLRGMLISATINQFGILLNDGPRITEIGTTLTRYWPLAKRWFLGSSFRGYASLTNQIPFYNLRGFGYGNDLVRGYELYIVNGQQFGLLKNSLRFQLFNTRKQYKWIPIKQFNTIPIAAYLSVYADGGYVHSTIAEPYQSRLANRLLFGGGVGLDVVTFYNLVFRFNASVNREGQRGLFFSLARDL